MNNKNFSLEMQKIIDSLHDEKPSLLLHCCCAPCATAVIEQLNDNFALTLFYYNPNTFPKSEHDKRLEVLKEYNYKAKLELPIITTPYTPDDYLTAVKDFNDNSEGSARCERCIALRLEKTAEYASAQNISFFASTLSVSPLKNALTINRVGEAIGKKYKINYLFNDFKKNNGGIRSVEISKDYGLYRQNYCGCEASKIARENKNG